MSGLPSALSVPPQRERAAGDRTDVLVFGLLDQENVGRVQRVDDDLSLLAEPGLVRLGRRGNVVERRADPWAAGVAGEVAPVERIVAIVVQVLHVERGDRELLVAVRCHRGCVRRRIRARGEGRRLDLDSVLVEGEVEPAHRVGGEGVEHPGRRQQDGVVIRQCLQPEAAQHDPVPVAVVERLARVVVQRVRVTEDAAGVRVGAVQQWIVHIDQPDLGVGRGREDVPAAGRAAAGADPHPGALVPLPVPVGVGQVGRRQRRGHLDLGGDVETGREYGNQRRAGQLGEVEELRHPGPDDDLVADGRDVAADQAGEAAHEDEDAVRRERVAVGRAEPAL